MWYPGPGEREARARAIAACRGCRVQRRCLALALRLETGLSSLYRFGIWGGLTPRERTRLDPAARGYLKAYGGDGRAPQRAQPLPAPPTDPPAVPQPRADPDPPPAPPADAPCEVCGIPVAGAYIARTGRARHGHHPTPVEGDPA